MPTSKGVALYYCHVQRWLGILIQSVLRETPHPAFSVRTSSEPQPITGNVASVDACPRLSIKRVRLIQLQVHQSAVAEAVAGMGHVDFWSIGILGLVALAVCVQSM